jgi:hypothetical protein
MRDVFTTMVLLVALTACTPNLIPNATPTPIQMADNFSFVFTDFGCGFAPFDILDTENGTLIHTSIGETESITIPFQLTETELINVFEKIIEIDFFKYPTDFTIPSGYVAVTEIPISSYMIKVTNSGVTHLVNWVGSSSRTGYPKADQLMELIRLIEEIIHDHPQYQQLPPPTTLCV